MGSLIKHKIIMSEAGKPERATTIPKGSTLEAIASGSARNLGNVEFNSLTKPRLRYSLTFEAIQSGGLLCEHVKIADKKNLYQISMFNAEGETRFIIVPDVSHAITKDEKIIITKIIPMNWNIAGNTIEIINHHGTNKNSPSSKKPNELKNNESEGQETNENLKPIKSLRNVSKKVFLFKTIFAKYAERIIAKSLPIMTIMISLCRFDGFVKIVTFQYMVLNAE